MRMNKNSPQPAVKGGERVDKEKERMASQRAMQTVMPCVLMILSPVAGTLLAIVLALLIG